MKNLFIHSITILSEIEKSAQQFEFHKKNLLISKNNDAGKTTLVDMIMWTFGCSPKFKSSWQKADAKSLVKVSIYNKYHYFGRDSELFYYKNDEMDEYLKFEKITGEFSELFSGIINSSFIKIENKNKQVISPLPEFFLAPMYIDQSSWDTDIFSIITAKYVQKKEYDLVLEYLTGIKPKEYFEKRNEIYKKEASKRLINSEIDTLTKSRILVNKMYDIKDDDVTLDYLKQGNFKDLVKDLELNFANLLKDKSKILRELAELLDSKYFLESQLNILKIATSEIEKDYINAVENQEEEIICPVCLVHHSNSLEMRARLLADNEDIRIDFDGYRSKIDETIEQIAKKQDKLKSIESQIDLVNGRFFIDRILNDITAEKLTSLKISESLDNEKTKQTKHLKEISSELKSINKALKNVVLMEDIEAINSYFLDRLRTLLAILNVNNSNVNDLKTPKDYIKLNGGKGSEGDRATLALYIALWLTMNKSNGLILPIFIDTFNQNEQDDKNYPSIIQAILQYVPEDTQTFICSLENPLLEGIKAEYQTLNLNYPILSKKKYEKFKPVFSF